MRFVIRTLISAAVIFGVAYLDGGALLPAMPFVTALALAVVLALINALIKPIVSLLSLPITIVTLGLFGLVINALMLWIAELIVGTGSTGFLGTIVAALLISVLTSVLTSVVEKDDRR
jgi:putative membrane protein